MVSSTCRGKWEAADKWVCSSSSCQPLALGDADGPVRAQALPPASERSGCGTGSPTSARNHKLALDFPAKALSRQNFRLAEGRGMWLLTSNQDSSQEGHVSAGRGRWQDPHGLKTPCLASPAAPRDTQSPSFPRGNWVRAPRCLQPCRSTAAPQGHPPGRCPFGAGSAADSCSSPHPPLNNSDASWRHTIDFRSSQTLM